MSRKGSTLKKDTRDYVYGYSKILLGSYITIPLLVLFLNYFRVDYFGSLLWKVNDGWCQIGNESIGDHCFGDFNERILQKPTDPAYPAWENNMELSPIGPLYTIIAETLSVWTTARTVLVTLILLCTLALVFPFYYIRLREGNISYKYLFLGSLASYPTLFLIDRLNILFLAVPAIFVGIYRHLMSNDSRDQNYAIACFVFAACIKPQFILLSLFFIFKRDFGRFFYASLLSICAICFLVLSAGGFRFMRLVEYGETIFGYGQGEINYGSRFTWPVNASLYGSLNSTFSVFFAPFFDGNGDFDSLRKTFIFCILGLLLAGALYGLLSNYKLFHEMNPVLIVLPFAFLTPGKYVAGYYLVFSSLIFYLMLSQKLNLRLYQYRKWFRCLIFTALHFSMTIIVVPTVIADSVIFSFENSNYVMPLLQNLSALLWYFVLVLSLNLRIVRNANGKI